MRKAGRRPILGHGACTAQPAAFRMFPPMTIWAISDLHLSTSGAKPMEVFGDNWKGHAAKISASWRRLVAPSDTVLVPGDISWALRLEEALPDLELVRSLPGRKILLRGNHDYWWKSLSKVRASLGEGCDAIQNDALETREAVIAGTRGWLLPGDEFFVDGRDDSVLEREVERLRTSLAAAAKLMGSSPCIPLVVMMHFPPSVSGGPTDFTRLISASGASVCIYGHLHGPVWPSDPDFELDGVRYRLASADWLGFEPTRLELYGPGRRTPDAGLPA